MFLYSIRRSKSVCWGCRPVLQQERGLAQLFNFEIFNYDFNFDQPNPEVNEIQQLPAAPAVPVLPLQVVLVPANNGDRNQVNNEEESDDEEEGACGGAFLNANSTHGVDSGIEQARTSNMPANYEEPKIEEDSDEDDHARGRGGPINGGIRYIGKYHFYIMKSLACVLLKSDLFNSFLLVRQ